MRAANLLEAANEKCRGLAEDNADYVKQLIEMKEKMGQTLNDLLSGSLDGKAA